MRECRGSRGAAGSKEGRQDGKARGGAADPGEDARTATRVTRTRGVSAGPAGGRPRSPAGVSGKIPGLTLGRKQNWSAANYQEMPLFHKSIRGLF